MIPAGYSALSLAALSAFASARGRPPGLPSNVAVAGNRKIRPTLREQPGYVDRFNAAAKGIARHGITRFKVAASGPSSDTRRNRRTLARHQAKGLPFKAVKSGLRTIRYRPNPTRADVLPFVRIATPGPTRVHEKRPHSPHGRLKHLHSCARRAATENAVRAAA